ncbi:MDR family MFS transporter [Cupriavidus gilardii]|uniref:MDR family MFS transporter n=1 Tax=Cupriavidus gilardii TaxID=82541 RepID=UPI00157180D6|nr:MDR family MFS transporter [Cupriavidus gilardii]NSX03860.1 MFS transporter [Cupriavidus gilardii]
MRVIGGIVLCILLAALDQTVVIPAVPAIAEDLDGFGHLSWIVTAYLITSTVTTPLYGKLSDSFGRRRLLLVAIALFVLASLACAMAGSLQQLILFRALQGIGGGGLMSLAQAAIADVVSPRQRGRYQGYLAAVWAVASVAGPLVGGWVSDHLSWRWLFWINLPLGLLAMWLCHRGLRALPAPAGNARVDWGGALLLTVAIVSFLLAMSWGGERYDWLSAPMAGLAALTGFSVLALVWQERRASDPMLPPRLFANRSYVLGVGASALAASALFLCVFALPLHFQLVRGADAAMSGMLVVPFLLSTVAGNFVVAMLAPRLGRLRGLLTAGFAAAALGLAALSTATPASSLTLLLAAMMVTGVGLGICMVGTLMNVQNALERRDTGAGTGALLVLRSLGSALGGALAGTLLTLAFRGALHAAGHDSIAAPLDLGALRHGSEAFAQLAPELQHRLAGGVEAGFHWIFATGAAAALLAISLVRRTPDVELRGAVSDHVKPLAME